jgi:glycosyltransferase involved in cell wall biosynthesis
VEVTVLCADLDPWQGEPGGGAMPVDLHQWYGATVVRLGLPGKPWDWHHDGEVERFCQDWFQRESFDEIEAHAVQILTAAPLRVALRLGIPYRVVLHDGWWLSRLQFLTRADGTAVDPQDPLSDLDPEADEAERQALEERRRDLREILAGAEERLAVSESFADLYRRAGMRRVGVRRNQAPEPAAPAHAASRWATTAAKGTDPVRFCMVGGMAVHKGYAVLRSAIQAAQLGEEARFTVVDHRLRADEPAYGVRWGGSKVEFIPPVPMAEMQTFYTSQDVLIAPSIWPESFGLVTREALAAGLWVIASQAGALAEPIEHAVNGLVVQPGSVEELRAALTKTSHSRWQISQPSRIKS